MNDGLLGFPGQRNVLESAYAVGTQVNYTSASTNPGDLATLDLDVALLDDRGWPLMVSMTLASAHVVLLRFCARYTTSGGFLAIKFYDNGLPIAPNLGGFVGFAVGEASLKQIHGEYPVVLQAGPHLLEVRHRVIVSNTSPATWGDRMFGVEVLA